MLATVEAIVERLVTRYDPDRIILFGSRAIGDDAGRGSDVDLLIVKQTGLRPIDRRIEVERLLADRTISLDLVVYTPEELRRLFAAGNPFIEEVIEHGRVLYMRKVTAAWLREAQDELETAIVLRALLWIPCLSGLPQLTVLLANGRVELAGQYRAVRAGSARARLRGTFFRMASRAQRTLARASPPAGRVPPAGEHAPDSSQPTCRPAAMMVQ